MRNFHLSLICALAVFSGCSSWKEPSAHSDEYPVIFPDYKDVTVPGNIAPLNFMLEGADYVQATLSSDVKEILRVSGRDGIIEFPQSEWRSLLDKVKNGVISVQVSAWNEENPEGIMYRSFDIKVSDDLIDGWLAYRLIEPGYVEWRQMGIYQRNLSTFEEIPVVTNRESSTNCVNCHHFPSHSSESMMYHMRGAGGGTFLYDKGVLSKIDFTKIGPKKNVTYPAWHPDGGMIAFSSNTTRQIFYTEGKQQVEVFDTASDLLVYDIHRGDVITDPRFMTEDVLETFPAWSHDGKYLYFASYKSASLPVLFTPDMHYDLVRVAFDSKTRTFGEKVDTLYNSRISGGSVSHPRISPDGRYLLYTLADYGTFPVWHREADLRMMDLETMEDVDVSVWNDCQESDSYHSWASGSRWVVFGSRRLDGRYTRLFLAYIDEDGKPHKPFLLPQEDPRQNMWRLKSYNAPEFIKNKIDLPL